MRFLFLWFLLTIALPPQAPATDIVPIVLRHEEWVSGAVLSEDGNRVLSWSGGLGDNTVRIWNLETQEWSMEGPFWQGGRYDFTGIGSVAWSPDNQRYAVAVQPVHTCSPRCGYQVWAGAYDPIDSVNSMRWHPDSRRLLVWKEAFLPREGLTLGVYDTETNSLLSSLEGHFDAVKDAVWAADGESVLYLAYNFDDNANPAFYFVGSWIPGEATPREQIAAPLDAFYVSWIPGDTLENTVVIAHYAPQRFMDDNMTCYEVVDCNIDHIWVKFAGGNTFTEFLIEENWANLYKQTVSPSGQWLSGYVADWWREHDGISLYLWDIAEPTTPLRLPIDEWLAGQIWNPDETRLLFWYRHDDCETSCNGDVSILNAQSGELTLTLKHTGETVSGAQWSTDGSQIMTWGNAIEACEVDCGSALRLWSADTGEMLFELLSDRRYVGDVIWRESENRVLVVFGRLIYIVDLSGATEPLVLNGHQLMPSVTWEGDTVLSWSGDETVRVWDLTGQTVPFEAGEVLWRIEEDTELGVTTFYGHGGLDNVVFNSDETALLSWSRSDNTARVWDLMGQHDPIVLDEFIRSHSVYLTFNEAAWLDDEHVMTHSDMGTAIWSIADVARLDDPERLPYEAFETITTGRTRIARVLRGWQTKRIAITHADSTIPNIVLPIEFGSDRLSMDFLNDEQWLLVQNESQDILWLWDISDAANVRLLAQIPTEGTPIVSLLHDDLLPIANDGRLKFYRLPVLELVDISAIEGYFHPYYTLGGWDSTNERLLYVSNPARDCEPDCHYVAYIDNPFDNTPPLELEHETYIQQADWIVNDSVIVTHSAHEYLSDIVTLWDAATGAKQQTIKFDHQIWFVTWDERHKVLLVASRDKLYLYDGLHDLEPDIYEHTTTVSGARLNSTGSLLVIWGSNGYTYNPGPAAIRVWRLE